MADPPVFELVDSSGNVVGEFKQVSGETVVENQENDTVRIPSLSTENLNNNRRYAANYNGADEDARLDNVLSVANKNDIIVLEAAEYPSNRTITTSYAFEGTATPFSTTGIDGQWTFDATTRIENVDFRDTATVNASLSQFNRVGVAGGATLQVNASRCLLSQIGGAGSVVFGSNTSDGSIGVVDGQISVTDNGTNQVL